MSLIGTSRQLRRMLQFSARGEETMRRRDFIAGLMFAAAMGRAQAQQTGKVYRIAFANPVVPVADIIRRARGHWQSRPSSRS